MRNIDTIIDGLLKLKEQGCEEITVYCPDMDESCNFSLAIDEMHSTGLIVPQEDDNHEVNEFKYI